MCYIKLYNNRCEAQLLLAGTGYGGGRVYGCPLGPLSPSVSGSAGSVLGLVLHMDTAVRLHWLTLMQTHTRGYLSAPQHLNGSRQCLYLSHFEPSVQWYSWWDATWSNPGYNVQFQKSCQFLLLNLFKS